MLITAWLSHFFQQLLDGAFIRTRNIDSDPQAEEEQDWREKSRLSEIVGKVRLHRLDAHSLVCLDSTPICSFASTHRRIVRLY